MNKPSLPQAQVQPYVGRFAPTPSGPLHLGSLFTAVASFLDARHNHGTWLLRIEDVDQPRCQPGAADAILSTLELYGLHWDHNIVYQSNRSRLYTDMLSRLANQNSLFPCNCSRKSLAAYKGRYPGLCRHRKLHTTTSKDAIRFALPEHSVHFCDRLLGKQVQHPAEQFGDVILKRKDGLFAYHWAVVVDDWLQGVTDVVRGRDLLEQTSIHWLIQQALDIPHPHYLHLPIVVNKKDQKLSKSESASSLAQYKPEFVLHAILQSLNSQLTVGLSAKTPIQELLAQATVLWNPHLIPRSPSLQAQLLLA